MYLSNFCVFQVNLDEIHDKTDPDFVFPEGDGEESHNNCYFYKHTIEAAMRYGLSNRQTACLINSLLLDLNIKDKSEYVSIGKILEQKKKLGKILEKEHLQENQGITALGLDSTKSTCLVERGQKKVIDNLSFTDQVNQTYLDHRPLEDGKAETVHRCLYEVRKSFILTYF